VTITAARHIDIDEGGRITLLGRTDAAALAHLQRLARDGMLELTPAAGWGDATHQARTMEPDPVYGGTMHQQYLIVAR
jgi:hypothetical protein